MKSLVVGEDNKNYREICLTDKKNISRLSAAGSKKTPLCYSKVIKSWTCSLVDGADLQTFIATLCKPPHILVLDWE